MEALTSIQCEVAIIDGELVFPAGDGSPDFCGLEAAIASDRQHELAVFAFDLLHLDGSDLTALPLSERKRKLTRLIVRDIRLASGPGLRGRSEAPSGS